MAYEDLIRDLVRQADAKAEEILSRGREEADRLLAQANEEAGRMEQRYLEGLEREVVRERVIRMNRIQSEARATTSKRQAALIEEAFARLEERLGRLTSGPDYPRCAERLCREILPELPAGEITVRADAQALPALKTLLKDRQARFEPLPADEIGGVEVSAANGRLHLQNTFRSRLRKARPELMLEIRRWIHDRSVLP